VVAGCFLIFMFSFKYNYLFSLYVIFVGLLGIMFSSFLSFFEKDIKKLVAWRTISQVGFILFIFSYG
jgi:NADH:ubiquinone oxidoreductase subunit 5 (subunit L)/multisubunit Na+/H+ antiporter MnhA subunit